jgi:hypothetical protein
MDMHGSERAAAAMLVLRVIDDIDRATDDKRNVLLIELLCAAWGDPLARNQ